MPSHAPSPTSPAARIAVVLPACVALAYGFGHLDWYLGTPLGRVPVLDERENLDLAGAIASGHLAAEPFYRAPGYALLLSPLSRVLAPAGVFPAALLAGVFLHAAGAALAARVARRWFGARGAVAAGCLYALNPVFVHYATQALDASLGLVLFLAGFDAFLAALEAPAARRRWAWASLLWSAAALVRPNYLVVWAILPLAALALRRGPGTAAACLSGVVLFGAQSAWQWRVSGAAGFLPWQGAYNLWSANRPGSNGLFFTQRVSLPPELARQNPARAESLVLYAREQPDAPRDIASMNRYWRGRFLAEALGHPARWGALLARKAAALLNDWEQYNNKTYAFHKERSPWLRWNPIGFGLVLILGAAGLARLGCLDRTQALGAACTLAAVAASVLLFFASARFRLPLAALLTALAGGAAARPSFVAELGRLRGGLLAGALAALALAAYSNPWGIRSADTFVQDHVLLARASYTVGDDAQALAEARQALRLQPWHPDALAIERAASAELARKGRAP